jgi:chromosomal replication initiation ATPase DnaA
VTPRERNLAEIDAIAQLYDYTVDDILGYNKVKALVAVRRKCVAMLRDKGYSTLQIGKIMNRDHSTICHALAMYQKEEIKALAEYELQEREHDTIEA